MVTLITGKHIDIGQSLQQYVSNRINSGIKNYLNNITQVKVTFAKESYKFHIDIIIHDTAVGLIKSSAENDDIYAAFDNAVVKIEKQLRRYHKKIKDKIKHLNIHGVTEKELFAKKYILDGNKQLNEEDIDETSSTHEPVTIAEKATSIENLTVSEAIMKMDLAHLPALLFKNKNTGRFNIIYYRADGNISWVDPESNF